jgi:SAM-dependent methyltransferase
MGVELMIKIKQRTKYDDRFFDRQVVGAMRSARAIVPIVMDLLHVRSVVDFGCGRAAWLRAFRENGVEEILGLDGNYIDISEILIANGEFLVVDLERPVTLDRRFDLAICLEVAEHLSARASGTLVRSLVASAPLVLFSAAIPGQGGTSHINEQWPEYWDRIFADSGCQRVDLIRPLIWQDDRVEWWYRQNLYFYAIHSVFEELHTLARERHLIIDPDLEIVSKEILGRYKSFRGLFGATLRAGVRALRSRSRRNHTGR